MGSLSREQMQQFEEQGFLVVKGLLDPKADLDPVIREYEGLLDALMDKLFREGAIASHYEELSFSDRIIRAQQETGKSLVQHFDFSLPHSNIRADTPIWVGEAVFNVLANPRLLDAVESIVGPEIYANPIQHVRMKLPEHAIPSGLLTNSTLQRTPWHQDQGVATPDADNTNMVTVWFPLLDVPVTSGPLQVLPGSHRAGLFNHCPPTKPGQTALTIPQKLIDDMPVLGLPMKRGDVLFMQPLMAHSAMPNTSNAIRWSFDLRFNPVGQPSGRDFFPGFVARSHRAPETELHDARAWAKSWLDVRDRMAVEGTPKTFNRWAGSKAEVCA